jgi:hypothetical protein
LYETFYNAIMDADEQLNKLNQWKELNLVKHTTKYTLGVADEITK